MTQRRANFCDVNAHDGRFSETEPTESVPAGAEGSASTCCRQEGQGQGRSTHTFVTHTHKSFTHAHIHTLVRSVCLLQASTQSKLHAYPDLSDTRADLSHTHARTHTHTHLWGAFICCRSARESSCTQRGVSHAHTHAHTHSLPVGRSNTHVSHTQRPASLTYIQSVTRTHTCCWSQPHTRTHTYTRQHARTPPIGLSHTHTRTHKTTHTHTSPEQKVCVLTGEGGAPHRTTGASCPSKRCVARGESL